MVRERHDMDNPEMEAYLQLLRDNYYISGWAVLDYTGLMVSGSLPDDMNPGRFSTLISALVLSSQNTTKTLWNVPVAPVVIPYSGYLVIILSAKGNRIFSLIVDKTLSVGRMSNLMSHVRENIDQAESGTAGSGRSEIGGGRSVETQT